MKIWIIIKYYILKIQYYDNNNENNVNYRKWYNEMIILIN